MNGTPTMAFLTLTGASGFIGSHVASRLAPRHTGRPLRLAGHVRTVTGDDPRTEVRRADLADPESLRGLCDGTEVLVHCAGRIGGTEAECRTVNADGTAALVEEALRAGVRRIVQLSTAAVYGRGPFSGEEPGEPPVAPASATSRSRAAAERAVLDAGGIVLRPHLVYGAGDRWVGPGLLRLAAALGGSVEGWRSRVSMVEVGDLARAVAAVALAPREALTSRVYHVNHPRPVPVAALVAALAAARGTPPPEPVLTYGQALTRMEALGRGPHDVDMVAVDHCFASRAVWEDTGCPAGPGFPERFTPHADWYATA
jgi:2-alkyl-3-oxoalkanoate reductase